MFRGDCFTGALHLQYYENIIACVWYLVEKSAEENIRYLEMKASPSGYTKKGLTLRQAVQALTDGADLSSLYLYLFQHKFIWTNFILTLKRHKTPYERVQEIASAIMFRETELEKLRPQIKVLNSPHTTPYEWQPSKVVAVDLAGYEKGYLPSDFLDEFSAIFQVCSYITIHAGEEESAQAIWEAIYKLHANRIGHGLTIHEFKDLMNLARDTQICLELCPTSNVMTNFRGNPEKYPLFKYMKEGLNVTINTDDRGTLGTTLSDEFVKSAELYYISDDNSKKIPLTKWETLRLIKAGFDNAFINREEKRKLLRWVEEEIYEKILQLYEIEPIYPVDKITEPVKMKPKLLILDDVVPYLESLKRVLNDDYEVITATSINEAKEKTTPEIDLFLIDICLDASKPGVDKGGVEVLRWVKSNFPEKPVVMMSAYRDFDAVVEALNLGADKFLKKPINIDELKETIKNLIGK
jgi:adenosine deaminase/ActR/RegA family two-component response regulator